MSRLFVFLGLYLLGAIVYWSSYVLIRPHIHKSQHHAILFTANLFLGLFLVSFLPFYLNKVGLINTPLVILLAFVMGIAAILHHVFILKDVQPWRGIITPMNIKVPVVHGAISHLSFSISYAVYGLILYASFFEKAVLFQEKLTLFLFVAFIEIVAIITAFDGIRMCYIRKQ